VYFVGYMAVGMLVWVQGGGGWLVGALLIIYTLSFLPFAFASLYLPYPYPPSPLPLSCHWSPLPTLSNTML